ncbi:conserved unknown protein [Ectocarpus siliculosus]|uniref:ABC transporter domain-containing protein n=1 Tax=Ectocarpus siliculosus TaxID=2880 RepID=D7FRS8_ECTSI|nr:conserved unknown protein [Ectocarpus siliculosus]|eukprot:CBJ30869.1 conserved unknown protein [Ectocarpus siliculosus]
MSGEFQQQLFSVDGSVPEGALCAIIGPTDSGKSALLALLSGRPCMGRVEGRALFEGRLIEEQQMPSNTDRHSIGFVRQGHTGYLAELSVFNNMMFAAMLRTPGSLEDQVTKVETVIGDTALDECRDTRASFLAAGEKRRLSLAVELLSDRRILLLDGVFSGLDTNESMVLMEVLKRLSRNKVTRCRRSSMWEEVFQPPLAP